MLTHCTQYMRFIVGSLLSLLTYVICQQHIRGTVCCSLHLHCQVSCLNFQRIETQQRKLTSSIYTYTHTLTHRHTVPSIPTVRELKLASNQHDLQLSDCTYRLNTGAVLLNKAASKRHDLWISISTYHVQHWCSAAEQFTTGTICRFQSVLSV